ncbi:MAG: glutamate-1-semialdehyde 2,1-aminomutase [Promethearchaeota archaeon]|jgi:glutamate-1-semialdehyde 2,1-aminomutase
MRKTSKKLYEKAKELMPGGVNSPVRAFTPHPFFTLRAEGSKLYDVDNNHYIDYCLAYGPLILGHANPRVMKSVQNQLSKGVIYGTPTELEITMAETISKLYKSMDKTRLVNSGTEATMHAIRAARGFTERNKIVKFEGCYHGAHDYVLVKAGSGATTFGAPNSLGIPTETTKNTLVLPYNDIESLTREINKNNGEIAAVIIEPVIGNAGLILPESDYLQEVRKVTEEDEILLIFDEVITGFRLGLGGAQEFYGIIPDLTTLGKIMGGGFPLACYGGKKEIMDKISPLGKIYQASTLSGNPISVIAGLTTINILIEGGDNIYKGLREQCSKIVRGLKEITEDRKIPAQINSIASMYQIFMTDEGVNDYESAQLSDKEKFAAYQIELLNNNIFIPPSQFETCFVSVAHSDDDIQSTIEAMDIALNKIS